jgi:hypothetical protein
MGGKMQRQAEAPARVMRRQNLVYLREPCRLKIGAVQAASDTPQKHPLSQHRLVVPRFKSCLAN